MHSGKLIFNCKYFILGSLDRVHLYVFFWMGNDKIAGEKKSWGGYLWDSLKFEKNSGV